MVADPITVLLDAIQRLSAASDLPAVQEIVRTAARTLVNADGATFVLRDDDKCHYADEDAIRPLWKGQKFPMTACISGWCMLNRQPAAIEDVFADERIPHDVYRKTFVKSLAMVPIRTADPIGAIGAYWAERHVPAEREIELLQQLANTTAVAIRNVRLEADHHTADRVFSAFAKALPGTVLDGKYRLDEELGAGGFGAVFRGWHLTLDCPVAVKVFRPVAGNDSAHALQRFRREGRAAACLEHPNAVRVFDSGVSSEGIAYLVMELLRGRSLFQELHKIGPMPLKRAAAIASRVADVLASAHARGLLHRDIKPDNIFLHQSAGGEVVKVVDFGIAKFFGGDHDTRGERLTQTGQYLGTPSFAAPERIAGGSDDGRSDVFSLGAVLYEMLGGVSPWTRRQLFEMAAGSGRESPPQPLSELRPDMPEELQALVNRCLEWDPTRRPTAAELSAELDALTLDDRPVPFEAMASVGEMSALT